MKRKPDTEHLDPDTTQDIEFLSFPEVKKIVGRSRVTLWRWVRAGIFPKPRQIGPNSVAWVASEVRAWAKSKAA